MCGRELNSEWAEEEEGKTCSQNVEAMRLSSRCQPLVSGEEGAREEFWAVQLTHCVHQTTMCMLE
jgi:hypothetical protein